jgi:protein ImuB
MLNTNLQLVERNASKEAEKLEELSHWAYRYTSHVHVYDNHTLLLEVGRSLPLFKGLQHLQHLIEHDLQHFGMDTRYGFSHTPKAAYLLSFSEQGRWNLSNSKTTLPKVRLSHLPVSKKVLSQLAHCGFTYLGDILTIPHNELGHRFGKEFITYLDQLLGKAADPRTLTTPPETFHRKVDFAEPIHNRNWIDQQINRLLSDLVNFIQSRQLVCQRFTWRFYQENHRLLGVIHIGLTSAHAQLVTFKELTDLKLANCTFKWAFSSIELQSEALLPQHVFEDDLFDPKPDESAFQQLLEKLSTRLGSESLYSVSAKPEHLPDLINHYHNTAQDSKPSTSSINNVQPELQDEPLWLLQESKKITQKGHQPMHNGALNLIHGPHRISSHWWQQLQSRDYYIARQSSGRLLWIYYERRQKNWYLHGLFA